MTSLGSFETRISLYPTVTTVAWDPDDAAAEKLQSESRLTWRSPRLVNQRQNDLRVMVQEGSLTGSKPLSFAKMIADRNVLRKTSAPSCHDGLTSSMKSSRGEASQLFGLHFHLGFWGVHWWLMRNYAVTMRSQASCSRCWWISILPAIFLMSCLFLKSSHNQRLASEKGAVLWLIWEVVDSWLIEPFWETEKAEIEVFVKSPSKQLESQSESCMQFKRLAWFPWPNPGSKSGQSWLGQRRRKPRSM